jgi:hypothetical protein
VFIVFTLRRKGDELLIRPIAPATCTRKRSMRMKKKIPTFKSDRAAAAFVDKAPHPIRPFRSEVDPL